MQVFTSSGDIGGAIRSRGNISNAPFVSGYRVDSTSVTSGSTGAWPLPQFGGFVPAQTLIPLTVTTSAAGAASFTYIPTCTGILTSGAASQAGGPSMTGGFNNTYTTGYQVAAMVYDTNSNRLHIWNPVSSAWFASSGAFTTT